MSSEFWPFLNLSSGSGVLSLVEMAVVYIQLYSALVVSGSMCIHIGLRYYALNGGIDFMH